MPRLAPLHVVVKLITIFAWQAMGEIDCWRFGSRPRFCVCLLPPPILVAFEDIDTAEALARTQAMLLIVGNQSSPLDRAFMVRLIQ